MNVPSQTTVQFRPTEREDTANLVHFAHQVFGADWTEALVDWKYFRNPAGRFYGQVAERQDSNGIVNTLGFYGNIPVRLKLGHEVITGAQAVDAMIAPEARRLGLFVQLNLQTYKLMDADGISLDYALPNPVSEAGFVKRLDWQNVGYIPRLMKILDAARLPESISPGGIKGIVARAIMAGLRWSNLPGHLAAYPASRSEPIRIQSASQIDPQANGLWQRISMMLPLAVQRDEAYLNWRYVQNPQDHYVILLAWQRDSLAGMAVISFKDLSNQRSASLVEWLYPADDPLTGLALLQAVEAEARQHSAALIQTWMLPQYSSYTNLLQSQGYLYSTARFTPGFLRYTTPLIIRQLPGVPLTPDPSKLENWYISMGDHDYY